MLNLKRPWNFLEAVAMMKLRTDSAPTDATTTLNAMALEPAPDGVGAKVPVDAHTLEPMFVVKMRPKTREAKTDAMDITNAMATEPAPNGDGAKVTADADEHPCHRVPVRLILGAKKR